MKHASRFALASLLLLACSTEIVVVDENGNPVPTDGNGAATPPVAKTPAAKVFIDQVAVYQGVKIPLFIDGAKVEQRNAPIVAGRPGVIRVFVSPGEGFTPTRIAGVLTVKGGDGKVQTFKDARMIRNTSSDAAPTSTLNFELPGEAFSVDAEYSVALTDDLGTGEGSPNQTPVSYPATGLEALGAQATGVLKVVIVPVKYDTDSSGRLPDVSEAQLAEYKKTMMGLYPTSDVQVTAREPYSWTTTISANGTGFDGVLNAMVSLRRRDRAADDVYYYGVFTPVASFESFCRRGCVTGLSGLVDDAGDAYLRASVGLGYSGEDSANTMAHEIGHAHGRNHAPCGGAGGPDRQFPYKGGVIGTWGYNILTKSFISPEDGTDMMGYCDNAWVSDYTYSALFDRITAVNGGQPAQQGAQASGNGGGSSFRSVTFDGNGVATSVETITLDKAPTRGAVRDVEYLGTSGQVMARAQAHVYKYDHLPGGIVVMPADAGSLAGTPVSSFRVAGMNKVLDIKSLAAR